LNVLLQGTAFAAARSATGSGAFADLRSVFLGFVGVIVALTP
jgi:hypothetical protein